MDNKDSPGCTSYCVNSFQDFKFHFYLVFHNLQQIILITSSLLQTSFEPFSVPSPWRGRMGALLTVFRESLGKLGRDLLLIRGYHRRPKEYYNQIEFKIRNSYSYS